MSSKLKIPEKGLFGLPSSTRQISNDVDSSTQVLENLNTEELEGNETPDTETLKNLNTTESNNPSTQELESSNTQVLEYSSIEVLESLNTEVSNNSSTRELQYLNTQESKNKSTDKAENLNTQVPKNLNTGESENSSTKDFKIQSSQVLPKKQKARKKDEKKPARKQASVHLTGATLKALHLFAFEEGLEKSEVVEKALKKLIPKKYFE